MLTIQLDTSCEHPNTDNDKFLDACTKSLPSHVSYEKVDAPSFGCLHNILPSCVSYEKVDAVTSAQQFSGANNTGQYCEARANGS